MEGEAQAVLAEVVEAVMDTVMDTAMGTVMGPVMGTAMDTVMYLKRIQHYHHCLIQYHHLFHLATQLQHHHLQHINPIALHLLPQQLQF